MARSFTSQIYLGIRCGQKIPDESRRKIADECEHREQPLCSRKSLVMGAWDGRYSRFGIACVSPCARSGAMFCSDAIVGPNQHSANRYSANRKASDASSVGA